MAITGTVSFLRIGYHYLPALQQPEMDMFKNTNYSKRNVNKNNWQLKTQGPPSEWNGKRPHPLLAIRLNSGKREILTHIFMKAGGKLVTIPLAAVILLKHLDEITHLCQECGGPHVPSSRLHLLSKEPRILLVCRASHLSSFSVLHAIQGILASLHIHMYTQTHTHNIPTSWPP